MIELLFININTRKNATQPIPAITWYAVVANDAATARHGVATLDDAARHVAARDDAVTNDATWNATADDVTTWHDAVATNDAANDATRYATTNDAVDADDGPAPTDDATAYDVAWHAVAHDATRNAVAYDDVAGHARTRAANDGANWSHGTWSSS